MLSPTQDNCFADYVKIRQLCSDETASKSGLYIEDLEGISLKTAAMSAGSFHQNAADLVKNKHKTAFEQYKAMLLNVMSKSGYGLGLRGKAEEFCSIRKTDTNTPAPIQRGLRVSRIRNVTPHSCFFVETVYIRTVTSGPALLTISDRFGIVLHTQTVTLIPNAGQAVAVNKEIFADIFYITLDNTNIVTYKSDCLQSGCCNSCNQLACEDVQVSGWDGYNRVNNGFGLAVRGAIRCSFDLLACSLLDGLKMPFLWLLGAEVLKESASSERTNYFTIHGKEWALEKIEEWTAKAEKQIINTLFPMLELLNREDPYCVQCGGVNTARVYSTV